MNSGLKGEVFVLLYFIVKHLSDPSSRKVNVGRRALRLTSLSFPGEEEGGEEDDYVDDDDDENDDDDDEDDDDDDEIEITISGDDDSDDDSDIAIF